MLKWSQLFEHKPGILTVVGMAKNAGKTVALNYVQRILHAQGRSLGLTSIGRDGERFDALTHLPKPSITVQPGTILATASKVVPDRSNLERIEKTGIQTPLGEIEIYRAHEKEQVILAGPSKNSQVKEILRGIASYGAECILIDGAFDRQSSADPLLSHHVILSSGATLSKDLQQVVHMTKSRVEQLTLSVCRDSNLLNQAKRLTSKVAWSSGKNLYEEQGVTSLLTREEWVRLLDKEIMTLFVKGAVSDALGEALRGMARPPRIILQDGSKIFINPDLWKQLKARGVHFEVVYPIQLMGVTVNPTFPGGKGFEPEELLNAMGKVLTPYSVVDVIRERRFGVPPSEEKEISG